MDHLTGLAVRLGTDTAGRFQGGERTVILVSATESDRAYLLASSEFLLDPRRLTVALSRAKREMVLVASRSVFSLFSQDEDLFANAQLWKNLLLRTCTTRLWAGEREGRRVEVLGGKSKPPSTSSCPFSLGDELVRSLRQPKSRLRQDGRFTDHLSGDALKHL
jgi:hypothetical protein